MDEAPRFMPGDPVRDQQAHDEIGRVETVRSDGRVNIRWQSGRTEWVSTDDIELAPGFNRESVIEVPRLLQHPKPG